MRCGPKLRAAGVVIVSIERIILPVLAAGAAMIAGGGACAAEEPEAGGTSGVSFTTNLYWVSDYRGRGITYSVNEGALQGGADLATESGWSAGIWASTFPDEVDADIEVDLYVAKAFDVGAAEVAVGGGYYMYPGADSWDYWEVEGSVSMAIGPFDASLSANYAGEQENLGDDDDLYVSLQAATPIGRLFGAPLTLNASAGWEEGFFAVEDTKADWSVGLTADIHGVELAVSYVDTDLTDEIGDGGWVFSIGRTFG